MARGKKTDPETVYKVMTSWSITNSYNETAKTLDMPFSTVKSIVEKNKDKDEFAKLRYEKNAEFSENATRLINKALARIEKMLDDDDAHIPLNHLSTLSGTLYDKRALANGESTANESIRIEVSYE